MAGGEGNSRNGCLSKGAVEARPAAAPRLSPGPKLGAWTARPASPITQGEVNVAQRGQLQAIHEQIYALEVPWAQHLEGSYIAKVNLRRVDPARSPYLYLDNGASKLTFDNHDNTAVFRWLLRERGLILAGPDPKNLIEPVSPAQLRREIRAAMPEWAEWAPAPTKAGGMSRWKQTFLVLSFCRMLHTLASGEVASKREAAEWALCALDVQWAHLIQRASGRPSGLLGECSPAR